MYSSVYYVENWTRFLSSPVTVAAGLSFLVCLCHLWRGISFSCDLVVFSLCFMAWWGLSGENLLDF